MKINVDLNTFTFGDLIDLQDAGGSLTDMQSAKTIVALVWLTRRRDDPAFTLEDARNTPVAAVDFSLADTNGDGADPKGEAPSSADGGG